MAEQALADIKVVDPAYGIAGPYCTKLPTDLGATVTRTEKPGEGDPARGKALFFKNLPHPEKSGPFSTSIPKKEHYLNLESQLGKNFFEELLIS